MSIVKRYIAQQVNPEYQEPCFSFYANGQFEEWPGISVFGNKDYHERLSDPVKRLWGNNEIDEAAYEFDDLEVKGADIARLESIEAIIEEYFGKEYITEENKSEWESILRDYLECTRQSEYHDVYCRALEVMTGEPYQIKGIHGCCQGEWVYICYPVNEYADSSIEYFETEYFNTGSEWIVTEDSVELDLDSATLAEDAEEAFDGVCNFSIYCHESDTDDIKQEIANALCCRTQEVLMLEFNGYRKIAQYNVV